MFLANAANIFTVKEASSWINPIFDAIERKDYMYVADILKYEVL